MAASQSLIAEEVLDAYSLARHHHLLDVGGGEGAFLTAVAARWPHLQLTLFDLPAVTERAARRLAADGIADRVRVVGGDFFSHALPAGADCVSLVRIIHDHDDPEALAILQAARRALPADGRLLLAEPMSDTPGAEPIGGAYFGFYLMAMGSGRPRSPERLMELLRSAGFTDMHLLGTRLPLQTRVMIARPD
jgi:demethylspheroidene O-methyltransferase